MVGCWAVVGVAVLSAAGVAVGATAVKVSATAVATVSTGTGVGVVLRSKRLHALRSQSKHTLKIRLPYFISRLAF